MAPGYPPAPPGTYPQGQPYPGHAPHGGYPPPPPGYNPAAGHYPPRHAGMMFISFE